MISWASGDEPDVPDFAPVGGTNHMPARSLAEAIWDALQNAEPGAAYLVGDRNLSFREFFQMLVDAAGGNRVVDERDEEHPLLPDAFIVQGRGNRLSYEPTPANVSRLGYTRNDCARAAEQLVRVVRAASRWPLERIRPPAWRTEFARPGADLVVSAGKDVIETRIRPCPPTRPPAQSHTRPPPPGDCSRSFFPRVAGVPEGDRSPPAPASCPPSATRGLPRRSVPAARPG
ncbi:hypothetical protein GCM10023094_46040 [Rhodococcus olei]|uniref:Uncharacterized protein n=1 Tax=Rhodococcus olei TaxID=2161675 RepID=A0ABP8PJP8_9NOCA